MEKLTRSQSIGLFVLLAILLGGIAFTAIRTLSAPASPGISLKEAPAPQSPLTTNPPASPPATMPPTQEATPTAAATELVVHVAGAVKKPGVYHLKADARNADALEAAGGATPEANTDGVNLAAHVQDGVQLYIPTHKEQPAGGAAESPPAASVTKNHDTKSPHSPASSHSEKGDKSAKLSDPSQGQINLNTADTEQLQRIPGIGPAMAEKVLAFRKENGGFKTIEDLLQVSGIGERKFEKMKPFVKVH